MTDEPKTAMFTTPTGAFDEPPEMALAELEKLAEDVPSTAAPLATAPLALVGPAPCELEEPVAGAVIAVTDDGQFVAAEIKPGDKAADIAEKLFAAGKQAKILEHVADLRAAGHEVDAHGLVVHDMVAAPRKMRPGVIDIDALPHDEVKAMAKQASRDKDEVMAKVLSLRAAALACRHNGIGSWSDYQQMYEAERQKLPEERRWW